MLLNQAPITKETIKLIDLIESYGLKIRLLNVRFHEMSLSGGADVDGVDSGNRSSGPGMPMPSREGLDEDYWYDDFGG